MYNSGFCLRVASYLLVPIVAYLTVNNTIDKSAEYGYGCALFLSVEHTPVQPQWERNNTTSQLNWLKLNKATVVAEGVSRWRVRGDILLELLRRTTGNPETI